MDKLLGKIRPDREERASGVRGLKPPKIENISDYKEMVNLHANWERVKGARRMLIGCIIALFSVYMADILIVWLKLESNLTVPLFELMKFLITSLAGYSFASGDLFSKE